jgi:phosphoglycolate phosphatase-like HAD superfamily hydrolase
LPYRFSGSRIVTASTSRPVDAVLFDWNGTLLDDAEQALRAADAALSSIGLRTLDSVSGLRATFRLPLHDWFADLGVAEEDLDDAVARWNGEMARQESRAREGARGLLHVLARRGIHVGVISAAATDAVSAQASHLGLASLLTHIDGGVVSKKDAIASRIKQIGAGHVLYVGDTEYDMTEALAASAVPVAITGGYRSVEQLVAAGAVHVCPTLPSIADLAPARPRTD